MAIKKRWRKSKTNINVKIYVKKKKRIKEQKRLATQIYSFELCHFLIWIKNEKNYGKNIV